MQLAVYRVNSFRAFNWIKNGWRLFTKQPGPFMAMAGIVFAVQVLSSLVPLLSYVAVFLLPFLVIGFYQVASKVEQDEAVSATNLFQYLSRIGEYKVLFRIAIVSILLSIPASLAAGQMAENMVQGVPPTMEQMIIFVLFMGLNFMVTAFSIPAAWVSPQTPIKTLVLQSLQACWQNAVPLTVYGIVIMAIWVVSAPILVVGWLIAMALSNLSFYLAFLDIFHPVSETSAETSMAQGIGAEETNPEHGDEAQGDNSAELKSDEHDPNIDVPAENKVEPVGQEQKVTPIANEEPSSKAKDDLEQK